MNSDQEDYYELSYYTLGHPDPSFVHQYIVDAYTAEQANENTKPIALTFALIGLYLHLEKNYTGKEVQRAHMQLAKAKRQWPMFELPKQRGNITVSDVIATPPGSQRDEMIQKWCVAVWETYRASHDQVATLIQTELKNNR
jgi:hypothetical protein